MISKKGDSCAILEMEMGDASHNYLREWAKGYGDTPIDPATSAMWAPPPGSVTARPADIGAILNEANSIIVHYSGLGGPIFAAAPGFVPVIPGPIAAPPPFSQINHGLAAIAFLPSRIANPGVLYPAIQGQANGSYLCTISYLYASGCLATIHVRRG